MVSPIFFLAWKWKWSRSVMSNSATPWTEAYQAPPSMGFSRQECWSGLPFPSPGDLPDPGIKPGSPSLQAEALLSEPPGKSILLCLHRLNWVIKEKEYGSQHCSLLKWSEVTQLCLTLCDPMDCTILHSSVHGIFQARVLEWVAVSFSRGSSRPRDQTQVSCTVGRCFTIWATREVFIIRETQVKTTMRCHLTPVRMVIIQNLQTVNAGEGVEERKTSCTVGGNINWYSHYGEQYRDSFKRRNKSTIWPNNPTTGHMPWENHNWKDTCSPMFIATLFTS